MDDLFLALMLLSIVGFIISLKFSSTKLKVILFLLIPLFFILFGVTADTSKEANKPQKDAQTVSTNEKPTETPKPEDNTHELTANVRFSDDAYQIKNEDGKVWIDCKLEMNAGILRGGYVYNTELIDTVEPVIIPFREFTKSDGTRFNYYETKPQSLSISCADVGGTGKRGFGYFGTN